MKKSTSGATPGQKASASKTTQTTTPKSAQLSAPKPSVSKPPASNMKPPASNMKPPASNMKPPASKPTASKPTQASGSKTVQARAPTNKAAGSGGGSEPVNGFYYMNCYHCKANIDYSTYICPTVTCGVRPFMACGYPGCGVNAPYHYPV